MPGADCSKMGKRFTTAKIQPSVLVYETLKKNYYSLFTPDKISEEKSLNSQTD